MRLKTITVALVLLLGISRVLGGDIDDDELWERLVKGLENDDTALPLPSESENWELPDSESSSLSESPDSVQLNHSGESTTGSVNFDLSTHFYPESDRRTSSADNTFLVDSQGYLDRGIKGATSKPKPGQTSLVIIFDGTGSMLDDLKQLQSGAKDIIAEITKRENNPIYNYIFIPFRDPDYGPVVNTVNQHELLEALDDVELLGGGDCPESSINAINAGLEIALPKSFVYIFTDAIAQDYKLADETVKLIQEKQITLTFLLTGFCNSKKSPGYYVYETLSAISNGQVYNLQKTDIRDVLDSIKQFLDSNLIPISYVYSENPGAQNIALDVSKNLKEFTVSLAGDKPNITVVDPNKENYKHQKDIVDLENLKIVNVQDPKPGQWNVHTQSESEHSVKLTAISDVVFKFGFSTSQPMSIAETEINPTKNVNNFLAVSTSNNSHLYNLTTAEIILFNTKEDPEEKRQLQINLPLTKPNPAECDEQTCLYITKAFPPPLSLFKVYVNGFDSDGNPLKYLLSTAIQAIDGDIPRVSVNESFIEVIEENHVDLFCKVISATPAAINWIINDDFKDAEATSEKDVWIYKIANVKLSDAGKYMCTARNIHGRDKKIVTLIVKEKIIPLQIKMAEPNMVSTENDTDYQISCFVRPKQKSKIEWYFNGKKINSANFIDWMTQNDNLVITRVRKNQTGDYTCVADNGREIQNATGHLNVFYEPEMSNPTRESRKVPFGEPMRLECDAVGSPKPTIVWHRENLSDIVTSTIPRFTPYDQGLYLCEASNGIGKATWKELYLEGTANAPPKIIRPPYGVLQKKLGDSLQLKCECSQCGPVHYYKWTKTKNPDNSDNEQVIVGVGPHRDAFTKDFRYDLDLGNLNATDEGYYVCEIGNEHGMDRIVVRINVLDQPSIEKIVSTSAIDNDMIKINRGENIRIECIAKGSPIPDIHWYKDDDGITPTSNIYTSTNSLIIRNVSETDMGAYKCVARNPLGTASKEVLLYVVVPPVFAPQKDTVITVEEGQTVQIVCDVFAMPFPDIYWTFNNNPVNLTDDRYTLLGSELSFVAEYKDNGIYKCRARNEAGEAAMETILIVYVPPKINPEEDQVVSIRTQNNITLECNAEGFPLPDIYWTLDGEEITNSSNAYVLSQGSLFLVNVNPKRSGPYICQAWNKIGEAQRTTFVTVTEPPKVLSHFETQINVTTDTSFSLICAAKGTPKPDVFWAKDGEKYTDGLQQQYLDVTFGNISSGNYTCIAQSPEGADTKTVVISAMEPPRLDNVKSILKTKINVTEGEHLNISCPFVNVRKVTWYKDDFRFYGEPTNVTSTVLHLPGATLNDRGNYTCVAENEAGSRNFSQEVKVLAPPRIVTNDVVERFGDATQIPEVNVHAGEDLEINCPMEGFPRPKVKWMKDNTVISTEPDLILQNVQPFHDGRYDCEARNSLGSADYSYIVKVLAPPATHFPKHSRKEVHEGEELELKCSFLGSPPPIITWSRNEVHLTETGTSLHINEIQPKDKGVYKCIGTNSVGAEEILYTVDVLESPKFTFINDNVKISEREDLMLRCAARGNPLPIVSWTYNGQMILGSSKIQRTADKSYGLVDLDEAGNPISVSQQNEAANGNEIGSPNEKNRKDSIYGKIYYDAESVSLMLIVKNTNKKLPGTYICHAVNALGRAEKPVQVEVFVAPQLEGRDIDKQLQVDLTILAGLPVILFCPWLGEPMPVIEWFKNDIQIGKNYRIQISPNGQTLTILASNTSDSGVYFCQATNDGGIGEKQFNVDILAPPHFSLGNLLESQIDDYSERLINNSPQHVTPGDKLIFDCPVSGNPRPAVFWLETTFGAANDTKILPETNIQLVLNSVTKSATYTCYANNSLGFIEKRYEVLVLKTPEVRDFQPQQTVYEHRTISLSCPLVGGSPKPEITWLKNGREIQENSKNIFFSQDRMLVKVLNAKKDDSGVYTCKAINLAGLQQKDINVTVITPVMWSDWSPWAPCSQSCGIGTTTRKRFCIKPSGTPVSASDPICSGRSTESKTCELSPCPIDGGWGPWSNWTSCSKSCWAQRDKHKPSMKRYRECNSPKPAMGGRSCSGNDYEEVDCNVVPCTVNGGWSSWTVWSPCSVSCGNGFATRYRECNNPVPLHGGQICIGSALESQVCYAGPCPIHGGWTEWSAWSECSQTCGNGIKKRQRICTNPEPRYGGLHCLGDSVEEMKCRIKKCENTELLKNSNKKKSSKPAQYESRIIYSTKGSIDFNSQEIDDLSFDYATGSTSYTSPTENTLIPRTPRYPNEHKGSRFVLTVEKITPINKDTTPISFHPRLASILIKEMNHCALGFTPDSNGTCVDFDECTLQFACGSNQVCINTIGSFICSCQSGFKLNERTETCQDIDECINPALNKCSHECNNTPGSFICRCPTGQILAPNLRNCFRLMTTTNDFEMSDPAARSFEEDCADGFVLENGSCQDVNECINGEDDCGIEQTCLNTKGSYLCIPTSCPDEYTRDKISSQCVLMCDSSVVCPESAKISQTLSYTLLTLDDISQSEPFLKLVNYDINRRPLPETKFALDNGINPTLFRLVTVPQRKGIAFLYGSNKIRKQRLYDVKIKAYSYDPNNNDLLYVTKFIIYLYVN